MPHSIKKMSLIGLILMIFTSVFGFANSPSAYYLMGYSAIPFYIFSALLFFIPFALMMAEMGAAYRKEEGGIYSWMNNSVGPRFALMNPLMILVKIIKLRWIHILSYDQMVSRKINNQTTRCANSIFYTTLFTNSAPNYT
ncbi:amino acid permease [Escherichia coli]|uniref:amino acid permease n=1 Tax=Escherichia coli TaxID=562 RepID=UPI0023782EDB|nr:amino acid permease [Escherichia coli]